MIRNYRNRHYIIITICATIAVLIVLPINTPPIVENAVVFFSLFLQGAFEGKTEKPDELTEINLSKANKYTLIGAFAALFILQFFADSNEIVKLPSIAFGLIILALVIFRSTAFLCLDRVADKDDE